MPVQEIPVSATLGPETTKIIGTVNVSTTQGDSSTALLQEILYEMRSMRLALVYLATEAGKCKSEDFDPNNFREIEK